jgi:hypothetical protein
VPAQPVQSPHAQAQAQPVTQTAPQPVQAPQSMFAAGGGPIVDATVVPAGETKMKANVAKAMSSFLNS